MINGFIYAFLLLISVSSQAEQVITLEDVVRSVLNSHLEIERQQAFVERSDAITQQASSAFDWNIVAEGGFRRPVVPSSNNGLLTTETETNNVYNVTFGMEKKFRNGITIAPGISYSQNLNKNRSDALANSVSVGHFAIKVPLLRGRGSKIATATENSSKEIHNAAILNKKRSAAKVIANSIQLYWQSVAAKRNLKIERFAGDEATLITENLKKLSEQGELSFLEYQSSVANLNLRRLKIEKSAATWNSTRRKLARLMSGSYKIKTLPITINHFPDFVLSESLDLDESALIEMAIEQRRDLLALQRKIESKRLNLFTVSNNMLPRLDLNLDLDKITLTYAQSLGKNLSKGRKRVSASELKAHKVELKMLKRSIADEVYEAIENLKFSYSSHQRAQKAYRLLDQIAATTKDRVTQGTVARNEYLSALDKLSEVERIINNASVDYIAALTKLRLSTGTLLIDSKNIKNTLNTLLTVPTNR